jgi:hypothetical protein
MGLFSESVLEGDLMAAVIGSIKEDGSDGGGADVSGREEEREELVGDSTRFACTGSEASLES